MSSAENGPARWLSLPQVAEILHLKLRDVRALVREQRLAGVRRGENQAYAVPAEFLLIEDGRAAPLPPLRGTLIQLADSGYSEEEAVAWLFRPEESLGEPPIVALRNKRVHAVRRAAQALAF